MMENGWVRIPESPILERGALFHWPWDGSPEEKLIFQATGNDMAAHFLAKLLALRPELNGCVPFYVGFSGNTRSWEFSVLHASLPVAPRGSNLCRIPADPAIQKAEEANGVRFF